MVLKRVFSLNTDSLCYVCSLSFSAHRKIFCAIPSTVTWILNARSALRCCLFTYWIVAAIFKIQLFLSVLLYAVRSLWQTPCSHTIPARGQIRGHFLSSIMNEIFFLVLNTSLSTQNLPTAISWTECREQAAFVETRSCSRSWTGQGSEPACPGHRHAKGPAGPSDTKISGLLRVNPQQQIQVNHLMRASRTCHQDFSCLC